MWTRRANAPAASTTSLRAAMVPLIPVAFTATTSTLAACRCPLAWFLAKFSLVTCAQSNGTQIRTLFGSWRHN